MVCERKRHKKSPPKRLLIRVISSVTLMYWSFSVYSNPAQAVPRIANLLGFAKEIWK